MGFAISIAWGALPKKQTVSVRSFLELRCRRRRRRRRRCSFSSFQDMKMPYIKKCWAWVCEWMRVGLFDGDAFEPRSVVFGLVHASIDQIEANSRCAIVRLTFHLCVRSFIERFSRWSSICEVCTCSNPNVQTCANAIQYLNSVLYSMCVYVCFFVWILFYMKRKMRSRLTECSQREWKQEFLRGWIKKQTTQVAPVQPVNWRLCTQAQNRLRSTHVCENFTGFSTQLY